MALAFEWDREELDLSVRIAPGAAFTTTGDSAALYIMLQAGLCLRLFERGERSATPRIVPITDIASAKIRTNDSFLIRPGGPEDPLDLFPDLRSGPKEGDMLRCDDGSWALLAEGGGSSLVWFKDWSTGRLAQAGRAIDRLRCFRRWTVWRQTATGEIPLGTHYGSAK
jgi:hypothetical protein